MTERDESDAPKAAADDESANLEPESAGTDDPFGLEEVDGPRGAIVSASHALGRDSEDDPFAESSRGGRTIFLFVGLVVAAIAAVIIYTIATQGLGTTHLADYEAPPDRASVEAEQEPRDPPPATPTRITSTPEGAAIVVNGVATRSFTPADVPLVDGVVNVVSLHLEGHDTAFLEARSGTPVASALAPLPPPPPVEETGDAAENEPEVAGAEAGTGEGSAEPVDPGPGPGRGRVRVLARDVSGTDQPAEVFVNGRSVGNAPVLVDVDAGVRHHVSARFAGMRDSSAYVRPIQWVDRNSEAVVALELTPDLGNANRWTTVRVRTAPAGADVVIDGETQPSTGLFNLASPDHHVVEISAADHEPLTRAIDGRLGQMTLDAILEPIRTGPAILSLTTEFEGATVFAERLRNGSPGPRQLAVPVAGLEVESGPYRITIEHRTEDARVRGRFETTLEPGVHHELTYALSEGEIIEAAHTTTPAE